MVKTTCAVRGCSSSSCRLKNKAKFQQFPRAKERCLAWITAIKRYDLLGKPPKYFHHKYICSLHFEECMYGSRNLKKNAVPTLNLPIDYDYHQTAPTTSQTCFANQQYSATREDSDHQALNKETALTTSQTASVMKQNTPKRKNINDEVANAGTTKVVIKHEPPESYEMTIEQEQIGHWETTIRHRFVDPNLDDSADHLIPKVPTSDYDNRHTAPTTSQTCFAIKQYTATREDTDHQALNKELALTTSQTESVMKQNTPKRKNTNHEVANAGTTEVVIKHEPPESSEMTIEQEQIGHWETTKRHRFVDPNLDDSADHLIPKVPTSDYDNHQTAPTTFQTCFAIKPYSAKQEDTDHQALNADTALTISQTAVNTGTSEVAIKFEPPESSETTIEDKRIGYYEALKNLINKGQRCGDSATCCSVEKLPNLRVPKVESMNDDPVEHNFTSSDKYECYSVGGLSTIPMNNENIKKENDDSFVKKETVPSNIMKMPLPISSKRNLEKLLRHTKSTLNRNANKGKKMLRIKNRKKEAIKRFLLRRDIYLSPQLRSLIKSQLNSKGDKFTNDYKMLCCHLFLASPKTYKFLSQVLCLPSKNDLTKIYFPFNSKINKEVLDILSEVGSKMSPLDKECVLNLGEIKLKRSVFYDEKADRVIGLHETGVQTASAGRYAYTVMLRGLVTDWKLLTGFSFTLLNDLNVGFSTWLCDIIANLFQIGFKVRAVCCPVLPVFTKLATTLRDVTLDECYFRIGDRKVYFIFDIRSTLKKARNALMKYTLLLNERKAWDYFRQLHHLGHNKSKRLVPQLKKSHIKLKNHHLKDLHCTSEVIDTSVTIPLNDEPDKKPCFAPQFINTMSTAFNVLSADKPVALSIEELQLFYKTRNLLRSIILKYKTRDITEQILFKDALIITINSISRLHVVLRCENLEVNRQKLTHSCMQSFHNAIRQLSGHSRRVTCKEYINAYRRCFIFHALRTAEKNDTTLTNSALFLEKYERFVRNNKIYETKKPKQPKDMLIKYLLNTSDENRFLTVSSYMLQRCVEKHVCPMLTEYVNSSDADLNSGKCEIAGLRVPPDHFLIYCTNLENYIKFSFKFCIGDNILKFLIMKVKELYFDKPCPCFPVEMLLKMFVKMRIKYNILLHNRKWKQEDPSSTFEFIPL